MKHTDEYRSRPAILGLSEEIHRISRKEISLMEVCGGHTRAIHMYGLTRLLPGSISLVSGPGCPVCVSSQVFIDKAVVLSRSKDTIIATYGDLLRVPGTTSSLERERATGADIRMVYSALESLDIAASSPHKKVVFLGIGFETTAPATAIVVREADERGLKNFFLLNAHKVMPPAMEMLVGEGIPIDGFIAPGHVSAITGSMIYRRIASELKKAVVISGFEPADILQAILMLVRQLESGRPSVEIQYRRVVKPGGNPLAQKVMNSVFEPADDEWRGLGIIPNSGLRLRKEYSGFDADIRLKTTGIKSNPPAGCICGEILKGLKKPSDCRLFAKKCTPLSPVGACMVSPEGACGVYYQYSVK